MSRSGFVVLNKVEAKIEELVTYNETVKIPIEEVEEVQIDSNENTEEESQPNQENETENESSNDEEPKSDEESKNDEESKTNEETNTDEESKTDEDSNAEEKKKDKKKKKKEPKFREEIQTKTKMSPHTFPVKKVMTTHIGSTQLNADQMKTAKQRLRNFDKRDEEKFKLDEAKNNFESILYSFRDWVQTEENIPFVGEERQEEILKEIMEHLDWLDYGDSDKASYKDFNEKYVSLRTEKNKLVERQEEFSKREQLVEKARDKFADLKEKTLKIREKKDWVTEEEVKEVTDKIEETEQWLEEKMNEQSQLTPLQEPAFTTKQLEQKLKQVEKLHKNVTTKRKPKKKKEDIKVETINMDDVETINIDPEQGETINFNS